MRNCNCRGAPHPPRRGIMRTVPHQGGSDAQLPLRAQAEPILNGAAVQVAVDCDYTLWREAVGEVGPGGVVFEHHHLKLQALLARLAEAGTLICLLSRNDPADVRATLALRAAEMLLQDKHIAAWAVDPLASKVHGLRALAQQLRLPTDAFALVDDNPTECMAVRLALPKVPAVQLGPAPAAFEAALARAWVLDEPRRVLTSEDRERARRYREDVARRSSGAFEHGQRPAATLFAALQITVRIWRVQAGCEGGGAQECEVRVAQLSERANQFNACKRILSATEVSAFRQRPGSVLLMASAGDRFGDLGQVGAVLLVREPETKRNGSNSVRVVVEAFIMSCRALGRGVEHAMLARAGEEALALSRVFPESDSQCEVLVRWEERERNAPVRAFLRWAARQTGGSEGHDGVRLQAASMAQLVFDPSALLQEDTANLAEQKIGDDRSGSDTATVDAGAEVGSENEQQEETSGQAFADIMWEVTNGEMCNAYGLLERVRKEQRGKKRISKVRAAAGSKEEDEALLSWYQQRRPKQERLWAEQLQKIASEVLCLTEEVELRAPLSEYGGDSLSGVTIVSRAAKIGIALELTPDFEMLSVQDLAHRALKHVAGGKNEERREENGSNHSPGSKQIVERDCRYPQSTPEPVGGLSACAEGNLEKAKQLATDGWNPLYAVDTRQNSALSWAAGSGHLKVTEWLVREVCASVDHVNKEGRSAVMWAAKNGHIDVVAWLIEQGGADVNLRMKDGSSIFDWAVFGGNLETISFLARNPNIDIHSLNQFGCGAAFWASAAGRVDVAKYLLEIDVDFKLINHAGHSAVGKAAWKGYRDLVEWLIEAVDGPKLGYQCYIPAVDGRTPLEKATLAGHTHVATYIAAFMAANPKSPIEAVPACEFDA